MKRFWDGLVGVLKYTWESHALVLNILKMRLISHYSQVSGKPLPSGLGFTVYRTLGEVPLQIWQACNSNHDVFLSPDYLAALETAPPDNMQFRYVVFTREDQAVAIGYFQILELGPKLHASSRRMHPGRKKTPRERLHDRLAGHFSNRIVICGNALLSGEHGYAFCGVEERQVLHALAEAAYAIREASEESIAVYIVKDFYARAFRPAEVFSEFGYHEFDAGPNWVVPVRPSWNVVEDYLRQMKPKYRKQAMGALKKGMPLRRQSLSLEELVRLKEPLYALYGEVVDKSKFKLFFLAPDYFIELKRRLGGRFVCEAYFAEQELVGFTTRIFNGAEMEGYTHGLKYDRNRQYEIYQNFMLDDLQAALAARCARINTGRTSAAMKSSLGAEPRGMKCYLRFSGKVANHFTRSLFYFFKPAEEYGRHPFDDEPAPEHPEKL